MSEMSQISTDLKLFKIEASRSDLHTGQRITPETVLGEDLGSGEPIRAGMHGRVEAITFSPADHALVILVRAEETPEVAPESESADNDPVRVFKIEASRCDLRTGDPVSPETVVGEDIETGETVHAGCHGTVEAISFAGADHALVVLIRVDR